jgi:predicted AlkP superfamily pyrophosphatase or phosphodiesterase
MAFLRLREDLEAFIEKKRFLGKFIIPDYDSLNTKNISSLVGSIFEVKSLKPSVFPEDYVDESNDVKKIVLIILDGLGYTRLLSHLEGSNGVFSEVARKGVLRFLTSAFPATTSTCLTGIFTGLTPAEHGIVGYSMFLKEYGLIINTLNMRPIHGSNPSINIAEEFVKRMKPWTAMLKDNGIEAFTLTRGSIVGSGLSQVLYREQEAIPYVTQSDMFIRCRKTLQKPGRMLLTMYYGGIDTVEHQYGPDSEEAKEEITVLESLLKSQLLDRLAEEDKRKTLMIITADHGVVKTSRTYFLRDIPSIDDNLLLPPTGDSRSAFLFSKYGRQEKLREAFEQITEGFNIIPSDSLIEKGVFGSPQDVNLLKSRVGDLAVLSMSRNIVTYPYSNARAMAGAHRNDC